MNELIHSMSLDMNIDRCKFETEESFVYRTIYSALGQWCLNTAKNLSCDFVGTTKHNQTKTLNELMSCFSGIYPSISDKFVHKDHQVISFPVHIRRIYEETGYLITDNNNNNCISNYGRCLKIGNRALFFGIPKNQYTVDGLGIFSKPSTYNISSKDFLIRDDLTCKEFIQKKFDPIDFYKRDINPSDLEFFNPKSNNVPSRSWENNMQTVFTIARKKELGIFYRVMKVSGELEFADEPFENSNDTFTSYEYRRLYFALKEHYGTPVRSFITKMDRNYSKIRVRGHLPNREYYYLLLLSWPVKNAFNKVNFLIKNDLLPEAVKVLKNIGLEAIKEQINEN